MAVVQVTGDYGTACVDRLIFEFLDFVMSFTSNFIKGQNGNKKSVNL